MFDICHKTWLYHKPLFVYCRELASSTVSLTGDRAQGYASNQNSNSIIIAAVKIGVSLIEHNKHVREGSGSVVECLTCDQGVASLSLTSVTDFYPLARHFIPCLLLDQPRKIRPNITERLLTGM